MGTLMVDWFSSLDGFGKGEGWPGYFGMDGPGMFDWVNEQQERRQHTILMGANTYQQMAAVVQESGDDPSFESLNETPKLVFSSTLDEPLSWANTTLLAGDAVQAVAELKRQPGLLRTIGSISLAHSLLTAGLVDRLRVMIFPLIIGDTGREPLYAALPDVMLELISSRTLDGRLLMLDYVPKLRR